MEIHYCPNCKMPCGCGRGTACNHCAKKKPKAPQDPVVKEEEEEQTKQVEDTEATAQKVEDIKEATVPDTEPFKLFNVTVIDDLKFWERIRILLGQPIRIRTRILVDKDVDVVASTITEISVDTVISGRKSGKVYQTNEKGQ